MIRSIADKYSLTPGVGIVVYDPVTLMGASMGGSLIGGAMSAASTLAGGSFANTAGKMQQAEANFQADQETENAAQAIGSAQAQMMDTQQRTRLAIASSTARAAAAGVNAGVGSAGENVGSLATRGSYQAAMDLFNGESTSTGLLNQATATRYGGTLAAIGGEAAQDASFLSATGTLAGTAAMATRTYGAFQYPTSTGRPGIQLS